MSWTGSVTWSICKLFVCILDLLGYITFNGLKDWPLHQDPFWSTVHYTPIWLRCMFSGDIILQGDGKRKFPAHSCLLSARSPVLAAMIKSHEHQLQSDKHNNAENKHSKCLELPGLSDKILQEMLRYIYTDRVNNLDTIASTLLPVGENYHMPGLKLLCERSLVQTITPPACWSVRMWLTQKSYSGILWEQCYKHKEISGMEGDGNCEPWPLHGSMWSWDR